MTTNQNLPMLTKLKLIAIIIVIPMILGLLFLFIFSSSNSEQTNHKTNNQFEDQPNLQKSPANVVNLIEPKFLLTIPKSWTISRNDCKKPNCTDLTLTKDNFKIRIQTNIKASSANAGDCSLWPYRTTKLNKQLTRVDTQINAFCVARISQLADNSDPSELYWSSSVIVNRPFDQKNFTNFFPYIDPFLFQKKRFAKPQTEEFILFELSTVKLDKLYSPYSDELLPILNEFDNIAQTFEINPAFIFSD
jgi:hypothetical protein